MSPSVQSLGRRGSSNFEVLITIWNSLRCSPENNSGYPEGILQDTPLPEAQLKQRVVQCAQKEPSYLPSLISAEKKDFSSHLTSRNCRPPRVFWARAVWPENRAILPKPENPKPFIQEIKEFSIMQYTNNLFTRFYVSRISTTLKDKGINYSFPIPNWKHW